MTGISPGFYARANAGGLASPSFSLRGVQSASSSSSQDRETSAYLDGVYLGSSRGSIFDIPDTERIEVLRGPQGTLFGRNATAGAVSIVTRNPTGEFGFRQDVTYGNYDQFRTRTSIDSPQIGPFSGYFTYVHDARSGDTRNLGAGTSFDRTSPFSNIGVGSSPNTLGGKNFNEFFVAVRFAPTNDFKMTYKFDSSSGRSSQDVRAVTAINTNSLAGALLEQIIAAPPSGGGAYGPVFLNPGDHRPDAYNNGWTEFGHLFVQGHNLTTDWQVSDHLALKNITAFRKDNVYGPATVSGLSGLEFTPGAANAYATFAAISQYGAAFSSYPAATQAAIVGGIRQYLQPSVGEYFAGYEGNNYGNQNQFSTELQANYTSTLMTLTVGGLYYHASELGSGVPGMAANFAFTPLPMLLPLGGVVEDRAKTRSLAAYAQADVHLTQKLDLQVGGRVTNDHKDTSLTQGGVFVGDRTTSGSIVGATVISGTFDTTRPTYLVGLNYRPMRDTMVYIKTSSGFLSGGAVGNYVFKPESVTSYEAGVKSDLLDRRLRVNGAIWQATYKHLQQAQAGATVGRPDLGVVVTDSGTLNAWGAELEVTAQPIEELTLGGTVGYTHKKLTDINPILLINQTNYKLAGIPSWTGSAYAQYVTKPLFSEAKALFRLDLIYQGKYRAYTDPDVATTLPAFAPYEFSPPTWLLNGRISLRDVPLGDRTKVEIAAWGRNITNNRNPNFPFPFGDIFFTDAYQPARTYGLDVILKY